MSGSTPVLHSLYSLSSHFYSFYTTFSSFCDLFSFLFSLYPSLHIIYYFPSLSKFFISPTFLSLFYLIIVSFLCLHFISLSLPWTFFLQLPTFSFGGFSVKELWLIMRLFGGTVYAQADESIGVGTCCSTKRFVAIYVRIWKHRSLQLAQDAWHWLL